MPFGTGLSARSPFSLDRQSQLHAIGIPELGCCTEAVPCEDVRGKQLRKCIGERREEGRVPLFQVLQRTEQQGLALAGLSLSLSEMRHCETEQLREGLGK